MTYEDALTAAREIQAEFPELLLSGSVALILLGRIPPRDVSDIDFACLASKVPADIPKELGAGMSKATATLHGHKCCVFANNYEKVGPVVAGIATWCPDDIIAWKRDWDRAKDRKDLEVKP